MESFQKFTSASWSADDSKRTMTKKGFDWKTVYGGVPIYCNGQYRKVHEFELKILAMNASLVIGIDEGTTNPNFDFAVTATHHYALNCKGHFYEKGIFYYGYRG